MTENSIISTLIWRHATRARQRAGIKVGSGLLLSSVNVRRRMDSLLLLDYVGKAIVLARAHTTAARLASDGEGLLYGLAYQIVGSVDWWSPDRIWELAPAIDASDKATGYDVLFTSHSRLGDVLEQASWGTQLGPIQVFRFDLDSSI
ncbi:hypothetical protein N7471_013125 [Penicillium samsonianum]|uniref:uncharacterized protein n=1 Tax=Penicillium samsonianum TaxID=1882272 RepID=UPI002546F2D5|nr:uncharacterized protein N7471_013125 [Penicillium samsonianum]KAJ6118505.1 hypothetical protein N7471_013125 [Penicillium samsonianum]